jgi:hypothetical protein
MSLILGYKLAKKRPDHTDCKDKYCWCFNERCYCCMDLIVECECDKFCEGNLAHAMEESIFHSPATRRTSE